MTGELSPSHWLIVIIVALLLFGSAKLPKMARSLGQSARILKAEMNGLHDKDKEKDGDAPASPSSQSTGSPQQIAEAAPPVAEAPRLVRQDGQAVDQQR
ncbi:Sec-independent protein translocase subunit TatA [Actinomadura harenae]|uniref:Sec-independent protein translocase protein TatA n=1 Tax=Actinomadura harenae TaxID=2483351 RepID=A0A3M2LUU5_9ACTN|nr:Sec-independent protein translocase subunit TatA [Actinomadura harenae]RMI41269.1 Sec-independent protein translocase subunit TatA [Actinomadura harenae]